MRRIAMGAAIASLRVQPLGGPTAGKSVKLLNLRSGRGSDDPFDEASRRVVVVCAPENSIAASLAEARAVSGALSDADLLVVPLVATGAAATSPLALPPLAAMRGGEDADGDGKGAKAAEPAPVAADEELFWGIFSSKAEDSHLAA